MMCAKKVIVIDKKGSVSNRYDKNEFIFNVRFHFTDLKYTCFFVVAGQFTTRAKAVRYICFGRYDIHFNTDLFHIFLDSRDPILRLRLRYVVSIDNKAPVGGQAKK